MEQCILIENVFVESEFQNCFFKQAKALNINYQLCDLNQCLFIDSRLELMTVAYGKQVLLEFKRTIGDKVYLLESESISLDFQKSDFSTLVLNSFDFKDFKVEETRLKNLIAMQANGDGFSFAGLDLSQAQLTEGSFVGADFSGCNLEQTCFKSCDLSEANFTGTDCKYTLFIDTIANKVDFSNSVLNAANFSQSLLFSSKFNSCQLDNAIFQRCDLKFASFQGSKFYFADLSYSNLSDVNFTNCTFHHSQFHGTVQHNTKFSSKIGVLGNDQELMEADVWML